MGSSRILDDIKETQAILARLVDSLEEARKQADPFGVFIVAERRRFRLQSDFDRSKSGKRTKEWTEASFLRAKKAGWEGDYYGWVHVLRAYTPPVALEQQS